MSGLFRDGWICKQCWSPNRASDSACYRCGMGQTSDGSEAPAAASPQTDETARPDGAEVASPASLPVDETTTPDVSPLATDPGQAAVPQPALAGGLCPRCGGVTSPDQAFCSRCGLPLAEPRPQPPVVATQRFGTTRTVRIAAAVVVGVGLIVLATRIISAGHTLKGSLDILQTAAGLVNAADAPFQVSSDGKSCWASGGYTDVEANLPVTVRDAQNNVIGASQLGSGVVNPGGNIGCGFPFEVGSLPDSTFYVIEAGSRRGAVSYSREEMEDMKWGVELTLAGLGQ